MNYQYFRYQAIEGLIQERQIDRTQAGVALDQSQTYIGWLVELLIVTILAAVIMALRKERQKKRGR